jgi:hypothetical protein
MEDDETIRHEIRDHAQYWHSDMAKRLTVEKHLTQKGIKDVSAKIDKLIAAGKLTRIPKRSGDYLKEE